ncbi:MAG: PD-(D/E)XK nuclease family protein [Elusimicrobiota bacterium]
MFELNYSKVNSYLFCPYLYKFIYIDKKYTPHTPKTSFGLSIHKTLREYARTKANLHQLMFLYEENWCNYGYSFPQQMMEYYEKGKDILKNFYEVESHSRSQILYFEDFFEVKIDEDFVLKGTVDRVDRDEDGKIEVIDYKLGFDDNGEKKDLQLMIYAYGVSKKYMIDVSFVSYYFLINPKKVKMKYIFDSYLIDFLIETGRKMENMIFDRKGNCAKCLAKSVCSLSEAK